MPVSKEYITLDGQRFDIPARYDREQIRLIKDCAEKVEEALEGDIFEGELVIEFDCADETVVADLAQMCRSTEAKYRVSFIVLDEPGKENAVEFTIKHALD